MPAEIYKGSCAHTGKGDNKVVQQSYGTSYCPKCKASKGPDGMWRKLTDEEEKDD